MPTPSTETLESTPPAWVVVPITGYVSFLLFAQFGPMAFYAGAGGLIGGLFAWPILWLALRARLRRWWHALLIGGAAAPAFAYAAARFMNGTWLPLRWDYSITTLAVIGALTGFQYWTWMLLTPTVGRALRFALAGGSFGLAWLLMMWAMESYLPSMTG
jgi:hypothetical protein